MKIGVLFDAMSALGPLPDQLILESVEAVEHAIDVWGHEAVRVPVNPDGRWVERVRRAKFDLVFNLCEGIDGVAEFEPMVIAVLELFGVPYSGNSSATTALCLHKNLINTLLDRAGLPVPRWSLVRRGDEVTSVGFPAICKPAAEDASIGIEQKSVVRSMRALVDRVEAMHERFLSLGLESPFDQKWFERPSHDERVTTVIDISEFMDVRPAALKAHRTQIDPTSAFWFGLPPEEARTVHPWDDFELARSLVDTDLPEDDLFAGVRDRVGG